MAEEKKEDVGEDKAEAKVKVMEWLRRHMWLQWVWGNVTGLGAPPLGNVVKCCAPCARNGIEGPHMHAWPNAMHGGVGTHMGHPG